MCESQNLGPFFPFILIILINIWKFFVNDKKISRYLYIHHFSDWNFISCCSDFNTVQNGNDIFPKKCNESTFSVVKFSSEQSHNYNLLLYEIHTMNRIVRALWLVYQNSRSCLWLEYSFFFVSSSSKSNLCANQKVNDKRKYGFMCSNDIFAIKMK